MQSGEARLDATTGDFVRRVLRDGSFRRAFLADPERVLADLGLVHLAPSVANAETAPMALDGRESRSSIGGVAAAGVLAAIGVLELADQAAAAGASSLDPELVLDAPSAAQPLVAPVDTALLSGPNAGGVLHPSEFGIPDPEGAPGPDGRVHAAYDLFAAADAPVRSPVGGTVVEASPSRGVSGQIYGGTVKVEAADGRVWVFRHVTPAALPVGHQLQAGEQIATVSPWTDGTPHVHIELWRTRDGGYSVTNMQDPREELAQVYGGAAQAVPAAASEPLPIAQSLGRASGVFRALSEAPAEPPVPAPSEAAVALPIPDGIEVYPGDAATPVDTARWMATAAREAGLPPELPVMASLVESGLRNLSYGDRDSVGFFQMRTGIWNTGEYAGYPDRPELQLRWFIDQAVAIKQKRIAAGDVTFGEDPARFGEWIADVERPAAQYRGRYQLRLDDARALVWGRTG